MLNIRREIWRGPLSSRRFILANSPCCFSSNIRWSYNRVFDLTFCSTTSSHCANTNPKLIVDLKKVILGSWCLHFLRKLPKVWKIMQYLRKTFQIIRISFLTERMLPILYSENLATCSLLSLRFTKCCFKYVTSDQVIQWFHININLCSYVNVLKCAL